MDSNTFLRYDDWLDGDEQAVLQNCSNPRSEAFNNTWQTNANVNGTPNTHMFQPVPNQQPLIVQQLIWTPTYKQGKAIKVLHETLYYQYPCVPCSYCATLLYPLKVSWIRPHERDQLPLTSAYPDVEIHRHPTDNTRVAVCNACKKESTVQKPVRRRSHIFIKIFSTYLTHPLILIDIATLDTYTGRNRSSTNVSSSFFVACQCSIFTRARSKFKCIQHIQDHIWRFRYKPIDKSPCIIHRDHWGIFGW